LKKLFPQRTRIIKIMIYFHVLVLVAIVEAIQVMIKPGHELCFWDQASEGNVVSHWFEPIKETEDDTLNMKILAPNDDIVIELANTDGERLNYEALLEGIFTWCYENSGNGRIMVHFRNIVGVTKTSKASVGGQQDVKGMEEEILQLTERGRQAYETIFFYKRRLQSHTIHADKALKAQTCFSLVKLVAFAGSGLSVVYWMRSLFETKRRI